jgi:hypothetical protein
VQPQAWPGSRRAVLQAAREEIRSTVMGNERGNTMDLKQHLIRQMAWSHATFGPGERTQGVIDHIKKELVEVERANGDSSEWVDVVILALDGLTRRLAFCRGERADPERVANDVCNRPGTRRASGRTGARRRRTRPSSTSRFAATRSIPRWTRWIAVLLRADD